MGLLANPWSKRLEQRRNGISDEAESLMIAFGVDAYEEARRRRTKSNSLSSAHYWLQVKTEIGRRILEGCRNADSVDALDAKLCRFEPTVSRSAWSHRVQAEALLSRLEGEPAEEPIRLARRRAGPLASAPPGPSRSAGTTISLQKRTRDPNVNVLTRPARGAPSLPVIPPAAQRGTTS